MITSLALFNVFIPTLLCLPRNFTEGPKGNGISIGLYKALRALSLDFGHDFNLPSYGWGIWPRFSREVTS